MKNLIKSILSVSLIGLLSVSCGSGGLGGSGITGGTTTASGGIGGTGISQGTVTKIGSITVNDVKLETGTATFNIDDNPLAGLDDVRVGMQVKVRGKVDDNGPNGGTGTATTVVSEPEVEGPVDTIDTTSNSLVVLGQTIIVDDSTNFEGTTGLTGLDALSVNDRLEVSGLPFKDDKIQATFIRKLTTTAELELKGKIKAGTINTTSNTFSIAGQLVSYDDTALSSGGMTEAELVGGLLVEVKGSRVGPGTSLIASLIKKEDGALGALEDERAEVEGLVAIPFTGTGKVGTLSVSGQSVTTSATTTFVDGAPNDILLNVRLEVEGKIVSGILVATKVKFHGNRIKIEADVTGTPGTSPNSVTLLGNTVIINGATQLTDKSSAKVDPFTFSGISSGDRLEIRGYLSNGVITATRVEREKPDTIEILQAPVTSISGNDLVILGLTVKTNSTTKFQNLADTVISLTDFFATVKPGTLVKARGTLSSVGSIADEVGLEED